MKNLFYLVICLLITTNSLTAQNKNKKERIDRIIENLPANTENGSEIDENTVFTIVEEMPQFPGGQEVLMNYIDENLEYPEFYKTKEASARVIVGFVIYEDGSVNELKIIRGVEPAFDAAAIKVLENMPNWIPGKHRDKAVKVKYNVPVRFNSAKAIPSDFLKKGEFYPNADDVYTICDKMPDFPEGPIALMNYIEENIKYPTELEEQGIGGRVIIEFIVEKDGTLSNHRVVRGIHKTLNADAMRIFQDAKMPKWIPGEENGEKVRVKYNLPVRYGKK